MTTNARDENWSEWKPWNGGECPLPKGTLCDVRHRDGDYGTSLHAGLATYDSDSEGEATAGDWSHNGSGGDIIAYRYKIKEPESDMHPDLEWLARNVSEWSYPDAIYVSIGKMLDRDVRLARYSDIWSEGCFTHSQWQAARQQLGLDSSGIAEPDEEECLKLAYELMNDESVKFSVEELRGQKYSAYFKDVRHIDTLDVYRVVSLFECEKHGHPISHAAKKLLLSGIRTGGKDVESDVREAIDTLHRWLEMREEDARA